MKIDPNLHLTEEEIDKIEIPKNSFFNKYIYYPIELFFVYYVKILSSLVILLSTLIISIWTVLSSKEAIRFYITVGKIVFFAFVALVFILDAFNKANRGNRRRNRY